MSHNCGQVFLTRTISQHKIILSTTCTCFILTFFRNDFTFTSKMSSRLREKIHRYALFYFPEMNELGTAHTSIIAEGYRSHVTVGSVVKVLWHKERRLVPAKIIQMDGM